MLTLEERIKKRKEKYKYGEENSIIVDSYISYNSSWYNYKQRLYDRIYEMIKYETYFTTLTYKNEVNEERAIQDMRTWSKKNCELHVSNIDYGENNGRLHIHSVCTPKKKIKLVESWKHGAINIIKIKNNKTDGRKVVMYVAKMMNHSIKNGTSKLIRSKKIKIGGNNE
jgi:KaiC/GvpD/RAD55 family RecA-like ATPase